MAERQATSLTGVNGTAGSLSHHVYAIVTGINFLSLGTTSLVIANLPRHINKPMLA
jgi:hypothetical protein